LFLLPKLPADTADKKQISGLQKCFYAILLQYSKSQGKKLVTKICSPQDEDMKLFWPRWTLETPSLLNTCITKAHLNVPFIAWHV